MQSYSMKINAAKARKCRINCILTWGNFGGKPKMPISAAPLLAKEMDFRRRSLKIELPEVSPDGLVPRFPALDTFTRPVDQDRRVVEFGIRPELVDDAACFGEAIAYDGTVMAAMNNGPDLSASINSLVYVRARFLLADGRYAYDSCSGVLVAPDIIFTIAHILLMDPGQTLDRIDAFETVAAARSQRFGTTAVPQALDGVTGQQRGLTSFGDPWKLNDPDFMVLKLENPFVRPGNFLRIPDHFLVPSGKVRNGEIVCFLGSPEVPMGHLSEALPCGLVQQLEEHYQERTELIIEDLVSKSCFGFKGPIASFGAIYRPTDDMGEAYIHTTSSTIQGMSGGPVVNLSSPNELLGFCVGGLVESIFTVFFRADSQIVVEAYKRFV